MRPTRDYRWSLSESIDIPPPRRYMFVVVELTQRTSSVFSAVVSNFKLALAVAGSELLVQDTRLPPAAWAGVVVVTVAFGLMVRFVGRYVGCVVVEWA